MWNLNLPRNPLKFCVGLVSFPLSWTFLMKRVKFLIQYYMMTSSNGKIYRVTGPFVGNSPVTGEFPKHRPVTRSFDVFFHLRVNKQLSEQSWGWWFETPASSLWRHCNVDAKKGQSTDINALILSYLCESFVIRELITLHMKFRDESTERRCNLKRSCNTVCDLNLS